MVKFALLLLLIVCRPATAQEQVVDERLTIECDQLYASRQDNKMLLKGNVVVAFEHYELYAKVLHISFAASSGKRSIASAYTDEEVILIDKNNLCDIVIANSATYTGRSGSLPPILVLKGRVRILHNASLAIANEFVYKLR